MKRMLSLLLLFTGYPHPKSRLPHNLISVKPADLAIWIRQALAAGWEPKKLGPQFVLKCSENREIPES